MKTFSKFTLIFLVCAVLVPVKGFSQERTNVIKANPLGMAFGNFNGTYEKVLNSKSSVLFSGSYMYKLFGDKVKAGSLGVGYRYYITHARTEVPSGFWVTPEARLGFGSLSFGSKSQEQGFTVATIGAQVGYQWAWNNGFTLDLGIGPSFVFVSGDAKEDFSSSSGVLPIGTLAIGYAF